MDMDFMDFDEIIDEIRNAYDKKEYAKIKALDSCAKPKVCLRLLFLSENLGPIRNNHQIVRIKCIKKIIQNLLYIKSVVAICA